MILITGATGFVGSHLMKHLNAQLYLIKGINLRNPNWYSELDADVSTIIHLAGKTHDLKKVSKQSLK